MYTKVPFSLFHYVVSDLPTSRNVVAKERPIIITHNALDERPK